MLRCHASAVSGRSPLRNVPMTPLRTTRPVVFTTPTDSPLLRSAEWTSLSPICEIGSPERPRPSSTVSAVTTKEMHALGGSDPATPPLCFSNEPPSSFSSLPPLRLSHDLICGPSGPAASLDPDFDSAVPAMLRRWQLEAVEILGTKSAKAVHGKSPSPATPRPVASRKLRTDRDPSFSSDAISSSLSASLPSAGATSKTVSSTSTPRNAGASNPRVWRRPCPLILKRGRSRGARMVRAIRASADSSQPRGANSPSTSPEYVHQRARQVFRDLTGTLNRCPHVCRDFSVRPEHLRMPLGVSCQKCLSKLGCHP